MCGFMLGNLQIGGVWKLLLCLLIFFSTISDDSSCLQLESRNRANENSVYNAIDPDNISLKKNVKSKSKDITSDKSAILVAQAKNINLKNVSSRPQRSEHEQQPKRANSANSTQGTLWLGYANDPFGYDGDGPTKHAELAPESDQRGTKAVEPKWSNNEEYLHDDEKETIRKRRKRGVVELYNMVRCATGCDPLVYKGYGCYCGFLGSGQPVDGIDKCCKMHDMCYDDANCPMYLEYVVPYYWKCYKGKSLCAIDHMDLGGSGSCAQHLCECDRLLSECLSRFPCPKKRARCVSSPWRLLQNTLMFF